MQHGTARLLLPFLSPGQAQKEFIHDERLQGLDIVVAAGGRESAAFRSSAGASTRRLLHSGLCATYRVGDWEIWTLRGSSVFIDGQQVVGNRTAAITLTSGGATIDGEARTAIEAILTALRQHGLIES